MPGNKHKRASDPIKQGFSLKMIITGIVVVLIPIFGSKVTRKATTSAKKGINRKPIEKLSKKALASPGSNSLTQAQSFYRTIQAGLQQPRLFPFQPRWSGEKYDPNLPMDDSLLDRLKKHVELRNFYSSNARLTQEFKTLTELLLVNGIEPDPLLVKNLYMCLHGIASPNPVLKENPELAIPSVHEEFEWTDEYYDPDRIEEPGYRDMVVSAIYTKHYYESPERKQPPFRQSKELLEQWGIEPTLDNTIMVHDAAFEWHMHKQFAEEESGPAAGPDGKKVAAFKMEFQRKNIRSRLAQFLGIKDKTFFEQLIEIKPESGILTPLLIIKPGDRLMQQKG